MGMPTGRLWLGAAGVALALGFLACARPVVEARLREAPLGEAPSYESEAVEIVGTVDGASTYLTPNVEDRDGTPAYVHVTEHDMPLRISIGLPKDAPRYGSRQGGRDIAIAAMREWEAAIAPQLPWFRLEFTDGDADAPVQVVWKRRINGPWAGRGGLRYWIGDQGLRVGGVMEVSTTPTGDRGLEVRVTVDELHLLIAHEFGHVLGLGHCFDCDSAMNYSYNTVERIFVTDEDVRAFLALVQQPSGMRIDGRPLSGVPEDAVPSLGERAPAPIR